MKRIFRDNYINKNFSAIKRAIIGAFTAGSIINDDNNFFFMFDSFQDQVNCILDHLWIYHPVNHLIKRKGLCIRFLIGHPHRCYEPDDGFLS